MLCLKKLNRVSSEFLLCCNFSRLQKTFIIQRGNLWTMDPISDGEDDDDEYRATFKPMTTTTIQKTGGKFWRVHPEKQKGANFLMRETEQWESGLIKQSIKGSTCNAFHRSWPRRKSDPGLRKPFITWYYFYAKPPTEPLLKRREKCSPKKILKEKIFKVTEILKPKQNVRSIKSEREN